jgi:hypothetical protein
MKESITDELNILVATREHCQMKQVSPVNSLVESLFT